MNRNHQRARGITQVSVAIPEVTLKQVARIAKGWDNSRNAMIAIMLRESVRIWPDRPDYMEGVTYCHAKAGLVRRKRRQNAKRPRKR